MRGYNIILEERATNPITGCNHQIELQHMRSEFHNSSELLALYQDPRCSLQEYQYFMHILLYLAGRTELKYQKCKQCQEPLHLSILIKISPNINYHYTEICRDANLQKLFHITKLLEIIGEKVIYISLKIYIGA